MNYYAVAWHPASDNLGDDLRTLAASRLLPRVDRVLDADQLDAPQSGLWVDDHVVTLLTGAFLRSPAHWPPEAHVAPVCAGVHFSAEDAWGIPFEAMDGAGRNVLLSNLPVGCRDERTLRLMEKANIPSSLTACVTLTLPRPETEAQEPYVCCVDVPEDVVNALREFAPGVGAEVRERTHHLNGGNADYESRMANAQEVVREYAGASFVVTRRLHCAMACLAVGTPVVLLYNSGYEDVSRFAPMDRMVRTQPVEEFVQEVYRHGFPLPWSNPEGLEKWREKITGAVRAGIKAAEEMKLPIIPEEEAAQWRHERREKTICAAGEKIHRLEQNQYEGLHEKFALLMKEDAAKTALMELLGEKEVSAALKKLAQRRTLTSLPWHKRLVAWWKLQRGEMETEDLMKQARAVLAPLGWPEK